jgi:hypothetical protein
MRLTCNALRLAAFGCVLGISLPSVAQVTPSDVFANPQVVEWPGHILGGAVRIYDINGNVIGGATHPMMVECPDGTTNCFSSGGGSVTGTVGIDQTTDGTTNAVHLKAGTAIAGKFGIDQTTPGTTNGVQVNAALPAGTNSIGQVTANAGTNLNTSALALDASVGATNTDMGPPGATVCGTDTGSCSINALTQRLAQRLTTINTTLNGSLSVGGPTASGSSFTANPLPSGGRAQNAEATAVTNGQAVASAYDLVGRMITSPWANKENWTSGTATGTDTSAHTIIASAGGSLKNYVRSAQCFRSDTGTSAIVLTFNDSASTVMVLPAAGTNFAGSGGIASFEPPISTAAATAFTFTSGTSTTTVYCNAQGFKGS